MGGQEQTCSIHALCIWYFGHQFVIGSGKTFFLRGKYSIKSFNELFEQILIGALSPLAGDPRKRFVDYVHKVLGLVVYILASKLSLEN
jgi:hypothetical protein